MKKAAIIELVQRNLAGGDVPADVIGQYDIDIVTLYVEMSYNGLMFQLVTASKNMGDMSALDLFTKAFIVSSIKSDTVRNKFYIELPKPLANVPHAEAIRYCGPPEDEGSAYIYRTPDANAVMAGLDIEVVEQGIRWFIENQRVYFYKMNTKVDNVMVKMLMAWSAWDDNDDIGIPAGADSQLFNMVVTQIQTGDGKQDVINDSVQDEPR